MTSPSPTPPTPSVIERLGALLVRVVMEISGRVSWGGISNPASVLLSKRMGEIKRRIERIVAQIRAGTYAPRQRTARPDAPAALKPRKPTPPSPLPAKFGWLMPLIAARPEELWHANGVRADLETMLNAPEMVALVAAAPVSLGRPLRSLCWALSLKPPPFLAPPRSAPPLPVPPKPPAKAKGPRSAPLPDRPPTRPDAPAWMQDWPPPVRRSQKLA